MVIGILLYIAFPIWILFLGGAKRLESTFLGYVTHGVGDEKTIFIKIGAWIMLA